MREAFLLADKYSCPVILNPIFDRCLSAYHWFKGIPTDTTNSITVEITDQDRDILKVPHIKELNHVTSKFTWFHKPINFDPRIDPIIVYYHGGGFALKLIPMSLFFLNNISKYFPKMAIVLSDYTVTAYAEKKDIYPMQLLESLALYKYVSESLGCQNIILMGESAGGNIALAVTLYLSKCGKHLPKKVVCVSPWLNPTVLHDEEKRFMHRQQQWDNLSIEGLNYFQKQYAPWDSVEYDHINDPFVNIEHNYDPEAWHDALEKCKILIMYGGSEILQVQIKQLIDKMSTSNSNNFSKENNCYIDELGCHIRPLLSLDQDLNSWSQIPAIVRILEFLRA